MIALLLLLAAPVPKQPLKPWTRDMCEVRQEYATDDYLEYCRVMSPEKHPDCPAGARKQPHEKSDRFEYWDCSWHPRRPAKK